MLTIKAHPLSQEQLASLQVLLSSSQSGKLLIKVIESQALIHEARALEAMAQIDDLNQFDKKALDELAEAKKYRTALAVLSKVINAEENQLNSSVQITQ